MKQQKALLMVAITLLLSGCAPAAQETPSPPSTSSTTPTEDTGLFAPGDDEPTKEPTPPAADEADLETARQRAIDAFTLYLRSDVDRETWLRDLTPYFTPDAYEAYKTVDPKRIPVSRIHADRATITSSSLYSAIIAIPTDGGTWHVTLNRSDPSLPWQVTRFAPPA